ncbi:MAG: HK97 family phage prohead protease [Clostridiales bacterium]|nr:HK97 family phage prohead protease [Clostridiales bacterium]
MRNREIRQSRTIPTEFRAGDEDGVKRISGYFAVFGSNYELWPGATESIDRGAFDDALSDDIRALVDHETRLVLGRNRAGTLKLTADERGLWGEVDINEQDSDATNTLARVVRGDVSQGSFGFDILEEDTEFREDGSVHWTIRKVRLYEVSVVTFPAYVDTGIAARKAQYDQIRKRQVDAWREQMKARMKKHA